MANSVIPIFVVYMGGCCGDLLTSILDWSGSAFNNETGTMILPRDRQGFKKPHMFGSDKSRDRYVAEAGAKYTSLPSHDIEYHVRRQHKFIGIAVRDADTAVWAATRFRECHRPQVWDEVQHIHNISSTAEYAQLIMDYSQMIQQRTNQIVWLEDIVRGTVDAQLQTWGYQVDVAQYHAWLNMTNHYE